MSAVSKSETAYRWIREQIEAGVFGPGYRLVLGPIADGLDMSVVPVREAVRRLEAEGRVEFERNVGARVAIIDDAEYAHTMQTLGIVEGAATALSAPLLGRGALERAAAVNEQLRAMLDELNPHAFTLLNRQFHAVLFEPCPNPELLDLVHRCWARMSGLRDSTFTFIPQRARESVAEHDEILALIAGGAQPLDLELAARRHRHATLRAYQDRGGSAADSHPHAGGTAGPAQPRSHA